MSKTHGLRLKTFSALSSFLEPSDVLDLEHAIFVVSECNGTPYRRALNKALYALNHSPHFANIVHEKGALKAFVTKEDRLYPANKNENINQKQQRATDTEQGKALLQQMVKNDLDLGGAGITCAKCKSTEISYSFFQSRSADEGSTCFCTCTSCGKRWKL